MVEALAQLGAIFAKLCRAESRDKLVVFSGIEKLRFRRLVLPGDVLTLKMSLIKSKFGAWKMQGEVRVGDDLAVDGILVASEIG